ncbi:MAG TPA: hypothetical protein VD861_06195 [Pyrinomonadaceae bacterium]|nr:hypothetical protein [Pyrinomonadaceae bacterium]
MKRERRKQTFRLRLLAFVLAVLLVWYSFNPAPRPVTRRRQEPEPPDEKKRTVEPRSVPQTLPAAFRPTGLPAQPLPSKDEDDDFEWPEFIDG